MPSVAGISIKLTRPLRDHTQLSSPGQVTCVHADQNMHDDELAA